MDMNRRKLIVGAGSAMIGVSSGCTGIGGSEPLTSEKEGDKADSVAAVSDTTNFEIEVRENHLVAITEEDHKIDQVQVLNSEGSEINSASVTGQETRIDVIDTGFNSGDTGLVDYIDEPVQIIALDESGDEITQIEFEYSPSVSLSDIYSSEDVIDLQIESVGNGGAYTNARILFNRFEIPLADIGVTFGSDSSLVDAEDLEDTEYTTNREPLYLGDKDHSNPYIGATPQEEKSSTISINSSPEFIQQSDEIEVKYKNLESEKFLSFEVLEIDHGLTFGEVDSVNVSDMDEKVDSNIDVELSISGVKEKQIYDAELTVNGFNTSVSSISRVAGGTGSAAVAILYEPKEFKFSNIIENTKN